MVAAEQCSQFPSQRASRSQGGIMGDCDRKFLWTHFSHFIPSHAEEYEVSNVQLPNGVPEGKR